MKQKSNTEFKAYLDKEQFEKFATFLAWLKKDKEAKLKAETKDKKISLNPPVCGSVYPLDFKHIEKEWKTATHHHWIENFKDEDTGEIIPIERKELLAVKQHCH